MSETIIKVEDLGKKYIIGHQRQERYTALRDVITNNIKSVLHKTKELFAGKMITEGDEEEEFWALQDINFDIKQGDRIGIIGRNGAGKSTLLKILSRITEPTKGRITINGRVASLLEVGTGFHPELSGRENIFLNGAILGMSRTEIRQKFDEIVNFAQVEKFLDTPVKRYSSGMYVRLAFAVAAHLESEVLIVDEVLAVGDAEFQKKCLGKLGEATGQGRTVLFVSHNMQSIKQLCTKGIVLANGSLSYTGDIFDAIKQYEIQLNLIKTGVWINTKPYTDTLRLKKISLKNQYDVICSNFQNSESISIEFELACLKIGTNIKVGYDLIKNNEVVFRSQQVDSSTEMHLVPNTELILKCEIPANFLNAGSYSIRPLVSVHCERSLIDFFDTVMQFDVMIDPTQSDFHQILTESNNPGAVFPLLQWSCYENYPIKH